MSLVLLFATIRQLLADEFSRIQGKYLVAYSLTPSAQRLTARNYFRNSAENLRFENAAGLSEVRREFQRRVTLLQPRDAASTPSTTHDRRSDSKGTPDHQADDDQ